MHEASFFDEHAPGPVRKKRRRRRWAVVLFVLAVLFLVAWGAVLAVLGSQAAASALDGRDAAMRARDAAVALEFSRAAEELETADRRFAEAERRMALLSTARPIPWVGKQVEAASALVDSGRGIIRALEPIVELGGELVRLAGLTEEDLHAIGEGVSPRISFEELSPETKRAVLRRLAESADDFELAETRIALARRDLAALDRDELVDPIADALAPLDERLGELEEIVGLMAVASRVLPAYGGLDGEDYHLLLFLNNGELRPGGGFIGTFSVLGMRDGDIVELDTKDVYALDGAADPYVNVPPPLPLRTYLAANEWYMRDANWSPDFRVSSRQVLDAFERETRALPPELRDSVQRPLPISGIIGFTPDYASALLEITGPIEAGGQTFTAENVFDALEYEVEQAAAQRGVPVEQRKDIITELVFRLKERLFSMPISDWRDVLEASERALEQKQLVLYSEDEHAQTAIVGSGWGGAIAPREGADQLMVVDANLAALKTDRVMDRSIRYELARNTSGDWVGRVSIHYVHNGGFDYKTTRYRTYVRVYAPLGSELVRVEGSLANDKTANPSLAPGKPDVGSELGFTTFGAFTAIEPGQQGNLSFEYILPESVAEAIARGGYDLEVFKQVGAEANPLTLDLAFGKNVTLATPPEDRDQWGDGAYRLQTALDRDRKFRVGL